jgi:hypothetical protein
MRNLLLATLTALSIVLLAGAASSQEVPPPTDMPISKAMFCDNQEDIETTLSILAVDPDNIWERLPESCGMFTPRGAIMFMVTPLEWYETPIGKYLLTRFYHPPSDWTQYGFVAYIQTPPTF